MCSIAKIISYIQKYLTKIHNTIFSFFPECDIILENSMYLSLIHIYCPCDLPDGPRHCISAGALGGSHGKRAHCVSARLCKAGRLQLLSLIHISHASIPYEVRQKVGITDGLIRLSIGIENISDLLMDLDQAIAESEAR